MGSCTWAAVVGDRYLDGSNHNLVTRERPPTTLGRAGHRTLFASALKDCSGSKCEELDVSISGPLLPLKADVRADVPVSRIRADTVAKVTEASLWNSNL